MNICVVLLSSSVWSLRIEIFKALEQTSPVPSSSVWSLRIEIEEKHMNRYELAGQAPCGAWGLKSVTEEVDSKRICVRLRVELGD